MRQTTRMGDYDRKSGVEDEPMQPPASRRDVLKGSMGTLLMAEGGPSAGAAAKPGTALLADPVYKQHDPGAGHPERPERYDAVAQALTQAGVMKSLAPLEPRPATQEESP